MVSIRHILLAVAAASVFPVANAQQNLPAEHSSKANVGGGKSVYNSACAGCHGLDGRGSDKGANISASPKLRSLSDAQLAGVISSGVPGTGMPAFRSLGDNQIRAIVSYVRSLQGRAGSSTVPGDAKRGQEIFFGKGACSSCHTISGQGGFLGPDLSSYAYGASANAVRDEITKTRRTPPNGYRLGTVTTQEGSRVEGVIRNEDNFTLQLQTRDGAFYFFQKSKLRNFDRPDTSLMPSAIGERLSLTELNDLVSYLMSTAASADESRRPNKKNEDEDE